MTDITQQIDQRIGEVRTDVLDLSFGEIVNLHANHELIIQPEYQRLFRWTNEQRSRLVESVLLELPIPQIVVIEDEGGVLELIDGLQRVSTIIQFMDPEKLFLDPLTLEGCDLIEGLNGLKFQDLPLSLRLRLKRSSVRTIIIKRQSKSFLRYEMFKRLNTGGSALEAQEIRNCSARMLGEFGTTFYLFLQQCANAEKFKVCIETLSESDLEKKGDEELVLRFFALKNARDLFRGSVRDWLDDYMEAVLLAKKEFNYESEKDAFQRLFKYLADTIGADAFVKYRGKKPVGALAPAYYEAVTMGVLELLPELSNVAPEKIKDSIINTVQSEEFRRYTGPGANTRDKLKGRVDKIRQAIGALL